MNILFLLAIICFAVGGLFSQQRQLQMLQQNSYYPSRYIKWILDTFSVRFAFSALFLIFAATLAIINSFVVLLVLAVFELMYRYVRFQSLRKASIKKLAYTQRVIRLICSSVLLLAIFIVVSALVPALRAVLAIIVILLCHFPQLLSLAALYCNMPMEKAIGNHYMQDAKKILRQNRNLLVIGVTGSYGKTSVKSMLKRLLSEKYNVVSTPESYNTPMGVVRTVREYLSPQTEIFIAEMGAKNMGDIAELCDLCEPMHGIITAVGPQHLETFKQIEAVADTKFELADYCLNKNGNIYVNFDSQPAAMRAKQLKTPSACISYGTGSECACMAENIKASKNGVSFDVRYGEHYFPLSCKLLGRHSIINLLGAVSVALDLGVDEHQIRYAASTLKPAAHRLELKPFLNGALLIDDAYNSNPEGCLEAVRVLSDFEDMNKIIVTPGLVELGEQEYDSNYALGAAAAKYCNAMILVGKERAKPMQKAALDSGFPKKHLLVVERFADAMTLLHKLADSNTVVLFENDLPDNYTK